MERENISDGFFKKSFDKRILILMMVSITFFRTLLINRDADGENDRYGREEWTRRTYH